MTSLVGDSAVRAVEGEFYVLCEDPLLIDTDIFAMYAHGKTGVLEREGWGVGLTLSSGRMRTSVEDPFAVGVG